MGLAASQARYLALTARKSDLEFQSQTINTRRMQLAYRTAEVAQAYSEGMNNKKIMLKGTNKDGDATYSEITFRNALDAGYVIIPMAGRSWEQMGMASPYSDNVADNGSTIYYKPSTAKNDSDALAVYNSLAAPLKALFNTQMSGTGDAATVSSISVKTSITEAEYNALNADFKSVQGCYKKNGTVYELVSTLPQGIYDQLTDFGEVAGKTNNLGTLLYAQDEERTTYGLKVNDLYQSDRTMNNLDLQTLLETGQAQIITKAFYDYLRNHGYDPQNNAIPLETYQSLLQEWRNGSVVENPNGVAEAIMDWRADTSATFAERNYTDDDASVLAKYEHDSAEIQAQDKMLEMQEKQIETQHKAIETELESIQKVIQNNIDKTFKIFS